MSETFFIGDTHFGHKGIINFSATKPFRPFETIEEHDEELVKRWNETVAPKDVVFVLGDFCFGKRNLPIAGRLNGLKKLVMGNHDMYSSEDYLQYFHKLYGCVEYKGAILTHIPVHPCQLARYYINVHGHLHTEAVPMVSEDRLDPRYICASAEQTGLKPIPYDEILNIWAKRN